MARKNMFEGIEPKQGAEEGNKPALPRTPEVFQKSGPIAAIRNDLRNVSSRAVQEVDPELVEDTGLTDRLGDVDDDIADLRDSISKHGQQVPILLRPHPTMSGRYQVVYGRRRLSAIRGLGIPVKALIRTLTDEEAVLAQGQENNLRKDPSFIEKALFAGDLEAAGYEARIVQDALNVNRSHTSHMRKVREAIPRQIIERIGAAPSVGWKRWYEVASLVLDVAIDPFSVHPAPFAAGLSSDQRFDAWAKAIKSRQSDDSKRAPSAKRFGVKAKDGSDLGTVELQKGKLSFKPTGQNDQFAAWLHMNAEALFPRLHEEFLSHLSNSK